MCESLYYEHPQAQSATSVSLFQGKSMYRISIIQIPLSGLKSGWGKGEDECQVNESPCEHWEQD